jgi:hypothetical protein
MANLHTDLLKKVTDDMARSIQIEEDRRILQQLGMTDGAEEARRKFGMDTSIYYLYLHLLKWHWQVVEVGELDGAYCVKIRFGFGKSMNNHKTFVLEKKQ